MWTSGTPMLAAFAVAVAVALHLHAGFRTWPRVTTISTVRPTVCECCARKGTRGHKGRSAEDRWQAGTSAVD
jgi:hypothetical protein